eukprot:1919609-Amphidinium_carterae.1
MVAVSFVNTLVPVYDGTLNIADIGGLSSASEKQTLIMHSWRWEKPLTRLKGSEDHPSIDN